MAKPIRPDPILCGKAAKEFRKKFLDNARLDPEKIERNKEDAKIYKKTLVYR